jgi:hypothetical protein
MGWLPFIVVHCVGVTRATPRERKGGDDSSRWQIEHALARRSGNGSRMKGTRARCCLYAVVGVVSWTEGNPGVHVAQRGAPAHRAYPAMHGHTGNAVQGASRCPCGAMRGTRAALCRGLYGMLLTTSAQPVGQAARGIIVEFLARHPRWRSDRQQQSSGQH